MKYPVIAAVVTLSLAGAAFAEHLAATPEELSQKLAAGKFQTIYRHGKLVSCKVTRSTGDYELDRSFCEIAKECTARTPPPLGVGTNSCMNRKQDEAFARILIERTGSAPNNAGNTASNSSAQGLSTQAVALENAAPQLPSEIANATKFDVTYDGNRVAACTITATSGNAQVDRYVCDAARYCGNQYSNADQRMACLAAKREELAGSIAKTQGSRKSEK